MLVVVTRTLILYFLVIIVMRLMGKRQIGQLQPFELVVAIMISELGSIPMQNTGIPLIYGIIPILTLLVTQILLSVLALKSTWARGIICGRPNILIENGKIREENLRKELYTLNDLIEQLRLKNVPSISDVEFAILETNGDLSVIPKPQKRTVTPEDMSLSTKYEGLPLDFIVDGDIVYKNLERAKRNVEWLTSELKRSGINDVRDVLFAGIDANGKLYFQKKSHKKR